MHILEHGNVVILYNKKASRELVEKFRTYVMRRNFSHWRLQELQSPGADEVAKP